MHLLSLAILVFAPLFFGSVHVWAFSVLNLAIFALALLWVGRRVVSRDHTPPVRVPGLPWYVGFICLVGLQLVPLPPMLLNLLSPAAAHIHGATDSFLGLSSWRPLSLVPFETTVGLVKVLAYGALFIVLVHTCRDKDRAASLVRTLIFLGAVLALYGLFEKLTGHDHIWRWKSRQHGGFRVTGTFINPDHFGTFLAMLVPLAFGYVYRTRISAPLPESERRKLSLFRRVLSHLLDPQAGAQKAGLLLFLTGMMAVALIMTGSRGAILAMGGSFLVMSGLVLAKTRRKGFAVLLGAALVVVMVYGSQIGIDQSLSRFSRVDLGMNGRVAFLTHAWVIMKSFVLAGTGLGTFPDVFVPFTPDSFARVFVNQLHNDWAEILTDTGLPGFVCLVGGFSTLLIALIRKWWTRTDPFAVGIGLGAIGGLTAAGVHALVDFGLRMPGNAVILVAVVAVGWAALDGNGRRKKVRRKRRMEDGGRKADFRSPTSNTRPPSSVLCPLISVPLLLWAAYTSVAILRADLACSTERNSTLNRDRNPPVEAVLRAASLTPDNPLVWARLGVALASEGPQGGETERARQTRIQDAWERAVALNPVDGELWYRLGLSYGRVSTRTWSRDERRRRRDSAYEAAAMLVPNDAELLARIGRYWVWRATTLPDRESFREPRPAADSDFKWWAGWQETGTLPLPETKARGLARARALMRTAVARNRGLWKTCAETVWKYFPAPEAVRGIVPEGNRWVDSRVEKWLGKL